MKPSINKYILKETATHFETELNPVSVSLFTERNPTIDEIKVGDKMILGFIRENYHIEEVKKLSKLSTNIRAKDKGKEVVLFRTILV